VQDSPKPRARRRPLRRSRRRRIVAGVCGGLAEWLGWRPLLVRVLFVLIGALPFLSGILIYVVLWLLISEEGPSPERDHPLEPRTTG
jgi:phage shock protein C